MNNQIKLLGILLLCVAGYFAPVVLGGSNLVYNAVVIIAIFAVMAYGVDIVLSDLGEVSLAHSLFFATGAYVVAVLGKKYEIGSWLTLLIAVLGSGFLAFLIGLLTLRTREFAFSLVTYATGIVGYNIAHNWYFLGAGDGIVSIPPLDLSIGGWPGQAISNKEIWPYAFGLLLIVLYVVSRFRKSRLGRVAVMSHLNPRLATMSGVNSRVVRLQVLVLSACITACGGWLYAYQRSYVGPDLFEPYFMTLMLTAVVITGKRILVGPLVGMALLILQKSFFSFGGHIDMMILGTILISVLALMPKGIVGVLELLFSLRKRGASNGMN